MLEEAIKSILNYLWEDERKHFNGESDHIFYSLIQLAISYKIEALYPDILRTLSNAYDDNEKYLDQESKDKIFEWIKKYKNEELFTAVDDDTLVCSNCISPSVYVQQFINPNDNSHPNYQNYEMIAICEYCNFEETELVPLSKAEK
jgi:hypothetical protein|tara:strand:+ start:6289 stop:6726 length:438 start_codon:yes stop_codon:yes gene_type:complete